MPDSAQDLPPTVFTASTLIPVSVLLVVVGGVFWLSTMYAMAVGNAAAITKLHEQIEDTNSSRAAYRSRIWEAIRDQDKRLASIEGKLDVIRDLMTERLAESKQKK